jgi:PE family
MAYVIADPEMMTAAAADLATIGSTVNAAHMAAAAPTVAVLPAAADEVSAGIAHLFSQHAQGYQALAGHAAAFHEQFVATLHASAGSYAATEAANAAVLQPAALSGLNLNSLLASAKTAFGQLVERGAYELADHVIPAINAGLPPSVAMLGAQVAVGLAFLAIIGIVFTFFAAGYLGALLFGPG